MELTTSDKAPRIYMGRILSPPASGHILRPGALAKGIHEQLANVGPLLESSALPQKDSLYADEAGALAELSRGVLEGCAPGDLERVIERVIDMRPYLDPDSERSLPRLNPGPLDMRYDESFIAPDVVPTAGLILTQERRRMYDSTSRSRFMAISQVMESYLLAAAVMRTAGIPAYLATSVLPGEEREEHKPLLAVIDRTKPAEGALVAFDLVRRLPPIGALEIISDDALWGLGNTMRATNKIKLLMSEISMQGLAGAEMEPKELAERIKEIAASLFECHRIWPGSHFIAETLDYLRGEMFSTTKFLTIRRIEADWESFSAENEELAASPAVLEQAVAQSAANDALAVERMALDDLAVMISGKPAGVSNPDVN